MANILLVEDEALVADALSRAIRSKGHTCVTASNGIDGIKRYSETNFDLVITDIIMPDKEGIELILEMRRKTPEARIIAISGGGRSQRDVEFLNMAEKLGAMASIRKPIRLGELFSVLDRCLQAASGSAPTENLL
jgi:YesN/AraC family two-component response regulator